MRKIKIYDTTLRDGEQSPGVVFRQEQKILIAKSLEKMGVDIIEAGFPATSHEDFLSVKKVASVIKDCQVSAFARMIEKDVDIATTAIQPADDRGRLHMFIAVSPIHMKYKLNKTPSEVLEAIEYFVKKSRNLCPDIQWCGEDASRADPDFLVECINVAIKNGAKTIMLPDTVGYSTPTLYGDLFSFINDRVDAVASGDVILSAHAHNDLGLATANSLSAISNGAKQVECTINGLGERAGNGALEEIIMALTLHKESYQISHNVNTKDITSISNLVSTLSGMVVQKNKAIVGANAFSHESGIHQDGILKHRETYEIIKPEDIGLNKTHFTLGKHSGRSALKERVAEYNLSLNDEQINNILIEFKQLADSKLEVHDIDLLTLITKELNEKDHTQYKNYIKVRSYNLVQNKTADGHNQFNMELLITLDGKDTSVHATGETSMRAIVNALSDLLPHKQTMERFEVSSISTNKDAQTQAIFTLHIEGLPATVTTQGIHIDTLMSTAIAYSNALNIARININTFKNLNTNNSN